MSSSEEIVITISPDGKISGEVFGVQGNVCSTILDSLIAGIGKPIEEHKKREFHEKEERARVSAGA
jgi:hypothetical protein